MSNCDSTGTTDSIMLEIAASELGNDFIACNTETACKGSSDSRQPASRVEVKDLNRNVRLTNIVSVCQAYPSGPNS